MQRFIIGAAIAAALTFGATPAFAAPGGNGNGNAGQQQGNQGNDNGQGNGGNSGDHAHNQDTPPVVVPPVVTPPVETPPEETPPTVETPPAEEPVVEVVEVPVAETPAPAASTDEDNPGLTCDDLRAGGANTRFMRDFMVALGLCAR